MQYYVNLSICSINAQKCITKNCQGVSEDQIIAISKILGIDIECFGILQRIKLEKVKELGSSVELLAHGTFVNAKYINSGDKIRVFTVCYLNYGWINDLKDINNPDIDINIILVKEKDNKYERLDIKDWSATEFLQQVRKKDVRILTTSKEFTDYIVEE